MSVRRRIGEIYPHALLDVFVILNLIVVHVLLRWHGLAIGPGSLLATARSTLPTLIAALLAAIAVRFGMARYAGTASSYRERLRDRRWWLTTTRLLILTILTSHVYLWLKLAVPLVNPRSWDQELWDLDQLFIGQSPNEVLLSALALPVVIRALDFIYVFAFFVSAILGFSFFASLPDDRSRLAYFTGNTLLWIIGVWLYVALPSLGPAYRFPDVWADTYPLFTESRHLQYQLLQNYLDVIRFRDTGVLTRVNVVFGIAAFPSLHVGFQAFLMFWMRRYSVGMGVVLMIVTAVMFVGSIVTGWHYAIDGVAGFLLAFACYAAGIRTALGRTDPVSISGDGE